MPAMGIVNRFTSLALAALVVVVLLVGAQAQSNYTCPPNDVQCLNGTKQCLLNKCPVGHFKINNTPEECDPPTPAPAAEPANSTTTAAPTTTPTTTANGTATTTAAPVLVFCNACHNTCKECTGPDNTDCKSCHDGFERTENGTCIEKEPFPLKYIIAIAAGGGALLIIIGVVIGVYCCCRRRRNSKDEENGGEAVGIEDLPGSRGSSLERDQEDSSPTKKPVEVRPSKDFEEPTYMNTLKQGPRQSSIEQGHDKMFRYVRDPTVKKTPPEVHRSHSEEEELKDLGLAPVRPAREPRPDEYEIADIHLTVKEGASDEGATASVKFAPKSPKVKGGKAKGKQAKKVGKRSNTTAGDKAGERTTQDANRRKTNPGLQQSYPAISEDTLPKFPVEEIEEQEEERRRREEKEERKRKQKEEEERKRKQKEEEEKKKAAEKAAMKKTKPPQNRPAVAPKPGKTNAGAAADDSDDDDDEPKNDYENEKTIESLKKPIKKAGGWGGKKGGGNHSPARGLVNPVADVGLDEPEDAYENHEAIAEVVGGVEEYVAMDTTGHGGASFRAPARNVMTTNVDDDEPQDVYANDVPEHPYQNMSFPGKKS